MNATAPDLLVVTPTLGTSRFLGATVECVSRLGVPTEHILVAPKTAVRELNRQFPAVRIVPEVAGEGMYGAINRGLAAASRSWEWCTYLNDDDLLTVNDPASVLTTGPKPSLIYGQCDAIDTGGRILFPINVSYMGNRVPDLLRWGIVPLNQQGLFLNRRAVDLLKGFDTSFTHGGDLELMVRAVNLGCEFRFDRRIKGAFRVHPGQLSKQRDAMKRDYQRAMGRLQRGDKSLSSLLAFRIRGMPDLLRRVARFGLRRTNEIYASD